MGNWSFVALAYGIVWPVILVYVLFLNRRLRKAESEKASLLEAERLKDHE